MYCSDDCKAAYKPTPHMLMQCVTVCLEQGTEKIDIFLTAAKIVIKHIKIAGSVDKLRGLVSDSTPRTVFDFDLSNSEDPMYQINMILIVNSLAKQNNLFDAVLTMTTFKEELFSGLPFKLIAQEDRDFVYEYLKKQAAVLTTNQFQGSRLIVKSEIKDVGNQQFGTARGSGLFPFTSLFNHSCDSNVMIWDVDNKLCLFAARPILAGEQLFVSYGVHFDDTTLPERRQKLKKSYKFECDCIACVKNYPLHKQLKRKDLRFCLSFEDTKSVRDAVSQFKKHTRYIEKNFKHHPSHETMITTRMLEFSLNEISKVRID